MILHRSPFFFIGSCCCLLLAACGNGAGVDVPDTSPPGLTAGTQQGEANAADLGAGPATVPAAHAAALTDPSRPPGSDDGASGKDYVYPEGNLAPPAHLLAPEVQPVPDHLVEAELAAFDMEHEASRQDSSSPAGPSTPQATTDQYAAPEPDPETGR